MEPSVNIRIELFNILLNRFEIYYKEYCNNLNIDTNDLQFDRRLGRGFNKGYHAKLLVRFSYSYSTSFKLVATFDYEEPFENNNDAEIWSMIYGKDFVKFLKNEFLSLFEYVNYSLDGESQMRGKADFNILYKKLIDSMSDEEQFEYDLDAF